MKTGLKFNNMNHEDRRKELYVGVCIAAHQQKRNGEYSRKQIPLDALAEFDQVFPNQERELIIKETAKAIERDTLAIFKGEQTTNIKKDSIVTYFDGFLGREPLTMEQKKREAADKIKLDI